MNNFRYFNTRKLGLEKGWKIHLSPFWNEINKVEKVFLNWVSSHDKNLSFKIMDKNVYYNLLFPKKREISSQIGKYITIYPKNEKHFLNIIEMLFRLFKDRNGISPISDRQYKNSSFINYRYGVIESKDLKKYKGNQTFRLPKGVVDKTGYNPKQFLVGFNFFKMIRDTNFGSVFIVKNSKNEKFIVKDGRKGIGFFENLTSAKMRKYEWNIFNKFNIGVEPIKKEKFLDHNFYVYKYIQQNKFHLTNLRSEFIRHYNNWLVAIQDFKKNILSKLDIFDYNISNFTIIKGKIIILDAKFIAPKAKKTYLNNLNLTGPILNWNKLNSPKKLKALFVLLLIGLLPNSAKKLNYQTLIYVYKKILFKFDLQDTLNININFKSIPIYEPSFKKVKSKIRKMNIEEVKKSWKTKINKKCMSLKIVKSKKKYESPWLDEGTLNLIYWTIHFYNKNNLKISDYSIIIKKSFETICSISTFKTDKLHGLRGLFYIWKILPIDIKKNINFDQNKLKETIAELDSIK